MADSESILTTMVAVVTKESIGGVPSTYIIRIYVLVVGTIAPETIFDDAGAVAIYDTNTINLRAATEYIALASQEYSVAAEDVYFRDECYDLELS
jgi:hypothetical protein